MFRGEIREFEKLSIVANKVDVVRKVIFAGAGTAGHVEPALAVAAWLRNNYPEIDSVFLGTAEGVETTLVPAANFQLQIIDKLPFPRRINRALFSWPWRFLKLVSSVEEITRSAELVIGFGGYVAAPAYLAARRLKIPMVAHEANAKMGLANRLARRRGAIVLRAFGSDDSNRVGIPLRPAIVELARLSQDERLAEKKKVLKNFNLDPNAPTLLIFGGSLGSVKFNQAVLGSQKEITRTGIQIIHAVGAKNELPQAQAGYLPLRYIDDMASAYAACDLVISRSGASTVIETGVLGIFSLYVPLPIGNGEQVENAREVVRAGGGEVIKNEDFTSKWLNENIARLLSSATRWRASGERVDFPLNASEEIGLRIMKVLAHE